MRPAAPVSVRITKAFNVFIPSKIELTFFYRVCYDSLILLRVITSCHRIRLDQTVPTISENAAVGQLKRHSSDAANNWPHVVPAFEYPAPGQDLPALHWKRLDQLN